MSSADSCCFCNNHCVYGLNKVEACATCAGSKQSVGISSPNCTAGGLCSVSQDTWFSLVITVLFARRLTNLCSQISSPQTFSVVQFHQQSPNWTTAEDINLLPPLNLPQTATNTLQRRGCSGRQARKKGFLTPGSFAVWKEVKWPQQEAIK